METHRITNRNPFKPLSPVLLLVKFEDMLVKMVLQHLVRMVDTKGLKSVLSVILEAVEIHDTNRRDIVLSLRFHSGDLVHSLH